MSFFLFLLYFGCYGRISWIDLPAESTDINQQAKFFYSVGPQCGIDFRLLCMKAVCHWMFRWWLKAYLCIWTLPGAVVASAVLVPSTNVMTYFLQFVHLQVRPDVWSADDHDRNSSNVLWGTCKVAHNKAVGPWPDSHSLLRLN